jgi:hypothetical protein
MAQGGASRLRRRQRSRLASSAPGRCRRAPPRLQELRWQGTGALCHVQAFPANEGSAAREAAFRIEPRAPASPAQRRAGVRAERAVGAGPRAAGRTRRVRQTPVHVHGAPALLERFAAARALRNLVGPAPGQCARAGAAWRTPRRLLPARCPRRAGYERRTRTGRGARAVGRPRRVRRTPMHAHGGFAGAARALRRPRVLAGPAPCGASARCRGFESGGGRKPARRSGFAGNEGSAAREAAVRIEPLAPASPAQRRGLRVRTRSRGEVRAAGRPQPVRQTPARVQRGLRAAARALRPLFPNRLRRPASHLDDAFSFR